MSFDWDMYIGNMLRAQGELIEGVCERLVEHVPFKDMNFVVEGSGFEEVRKLHVKDKLLGEFKWVRMDPEGLKWMYTWDPVGVPEEWLD